MCATAILDREILCSSVNFTRDQFLVRYRFKPEIFNATGRGNENGI